MSCQGFVLLILNIDNYTTPGIMPEVFAPSCLATTFGPAHDEPHFSQGNWSFSCLGSQEMDFGHGFGLKAGHGKDGVNDCY